MLSIRRSLLLLYATVLCVRCDMESDERLPPRDSRELNDPEIVKAAEVGGRKNPLAFETLLFVVCTGGA